MTHSESFLSFFSNRFPGIGERIMKQLSAVDIAHSMEACQQIKDFVLKHEGRRLAFDKKAKMALHQAAAKNNAEVVEALCKSMSMEQISFRNDIDEDGLQSGALHQAAFFGHLEVVKVLCHFLSKEHIALKEIGTKHHGCLGWKGNTALHIAVLRRNFEIVKVLCQNLSTELIVTENDDGMSPLHIAASGLGYCNIDCQVEIVKFFCQVLPMEHLGTRCSQKGFTPLHYAASARGHFEVVEVLCQNLSVEQISLKDNYGMTPLHYAAARQNRETVNFLCQYVGQPQRFIF